MTCISIAFIIFFLVLGLFALMRIVCCRFHDIYQRKIDHNHTVHTPYWVLHYIHDTVHTFSVILGMIHIQSVCLQTIEHLLGHSITIARHIQSHHQNVSHMNNWNIFKQSELLKKRLCYYFGSSDIQWTTYSNYDGSFFINYGALYRLLWNIYTNAYRANRKNNTSLIHTEYSIINGVITISIYDTGTGFSYHDYMHYTNLAHNHFGISIIQGCVTELGGKILFPKTNRIFSGAHIMIQVPYYSCDESIQEE